MSPEEHYQKGMEYFGEDQLELAIEELTQAVSKKPDFGDALQALTMCYYNIGNFDEALKYGDQFSTLEPTNSLAYTTLSMIYRAKGMTQDAEDMTQIVETLEYGGTDDRNYGEDQPMDLQQENLKSSVESIERKVGHLTSELKELRESIDKLPKRWQSDLTALAVFLVVMIVTFTQC
jgi:tetratricopeptide (TPR) repeat protein